MILFALGLFFGLSYVELGLFVRVPDSMAAEYFALANDLAPVLREEMHHERIARRPEGRRWQDLSSNRRAQTAQ